MDNEHWEGGCSTADWSRQNNTNKGGGALELVTLVPSEYLSVNLLSLLSLKVSRSLRREKLGSASESPNHSVVPLNRKVSWLPLGLCLKIVIHSPVGATGTHSEDPVHAYVSSGHAVQLLAVTCVSFVYVLTGHGTHHAPLAATNSPGSQ
eukprot:3459371-Rhodomonas_salina.1